MTLYATDPALAWLAKKRSTTTRPQIKVDSNFSCEYDADGYFPGTVDFDASVHILTNLIKIQNIVIYIIIAVLVHIKCCNVLPIFGILQKQEDANGQINQIVLYTYVFSRNIYLCFCFNANR